MERTFKVIGLGVFILLVMAGCAIWLGVWVLLALVAHSVGEGPVFALCALIIGAAPTAFGIILGYKIWRSRCTSRSSR